MNTSFSTVIVGSGCAGLNAADWLWDLGQRDILLVTEGMNMGTSRNTGSDKQTYYKLSLSGDDGDSVGELTKSLAVSGADGDTALCMAAGSVESFMKLCRLGVPFPRNEYGEYVGYRTDHDTRMRATSVGPLTSRQMTEALEASIRGKDIPVMDGWIACEIFTENDKVIGVCLMNANTGEWLKVQCDNIIVCTGGPAAAYRDCVYPESQTGSMGLLMRAGVPMVNMNIWQYGLASTVFRWNVSGSYQQVLPRYYSVDSEGREYDFLSDFDLTLRFRKGYEWPFDPKKADASSGVDLHVLEQTALGRKVYMDFRRNPVGFDWNRLKPEAREYLEKCGAIQDTPIERLRAMNEPAIDLYAGHGIDISKEPLEVRVCAQHLNGGAEVDSNWETCIRGLYVAGEAAGTFGITRPGGSALNATQVGSMRAAMHIAGKKKGTEQTRNLPEPSVRPMNPNEWDELQKEMSQYGAIVRQADKLETVAEKIRESYSGQTKTVFELKPALRVDAFRAEEAMLAQWAMARSMTAPAGEGVLCARLDANEILVSWRKERPVPDRDLWFESVWKKNRNA